MRDAAGELPDRLHLLRLVQAELGLVAAPRFELELGGALAHALLELLVHARDFLGGGRERRLGRLAVRDVEVDAAVAQRRAVGCTDHAAAPEDPARHAVGTQDPVLDLVAVVAALERAPESCDHAVAVVRMAQRAHDVDRHAVGGGREAHDPEELRGAANPRGREVDAPHADARRLLRERQGVTVEGIAVQKPERLASRHLSFASARRGPGYYSAGRSRIARRRRPAVTIEGESRLRIAAILAVALFTAAASRAATLVINANASDPAPRAAWRAVVDRFTREHPDVKVELNVYDHESYKKAIRNWLTGTPPDVVFWFAGERMRQLSDPGLLEDVSDLYATEARTAFHPSSIELVTDRGRQYGVPYASYQIGLYYRRDLLEAAGIAPPRTWNDLVVACEKLVARGMEPIAIGTRDLWPAAAWFDYLDLRINGLAFHMALMQGRVRYTDARVRAVLAAWEQLLARNCFCRQSRVEQLAGEPGAAVPGQERDDADRQLHRPELSRVVARADGLHSLPRRRRGHAAVRGGPRQHPAHPGART